MDATIFSSDGLGDQGPGVNGAEEGAQGGSGKSAVAFQALLGSHGDGKGGREAVGDFGRVAVAGRAPGGHGDRSDQEAGGGYGRVAAEGQDPGGSSGGYGRAPVAGQAPGGARGGHGDGRASVAGQAPCGSSAGQESVHGSGQDRQESVGYYIKSAMATTSDYQEAVGGNGRAAVCYRYDRYNQYMDLYLRGRPTSSFWEPIWLSKPLVFHDKGMLLAHEYLLERNPEFEPSSTRYYEHDLVDLTDEVTDVLNNHPGPMKCFRMDSSYWNNSTLDYWVSVLSTKRIQKLTLVNLSHPCNLEFPIYDLQSSNLDSLSLAFMTIPDMDVNCFEYSNLTSLQLSACSFNGRMLSWIVSDCPRLQKLTIGLCIENLRLISKTLEKIILWQCKASWIIVSECPKLRHLIVGVWPAAGCRTVSITLDCVPKLEDIEDLNLSQHDIYINQTLITKDCFPVSSLEKLSLGLYFGDAYQRKSLLNVLCCFPMLTHLTIQRLDEVELGEGTDTCADSTFRRLSNTPCMSQLKHFTIQFFRGGPTELEILRCILQYGSHLLEVHVECSKTLTRQEREWAVQQLRECPSSSPACCVKIRVP